MNTERETIQRSFMMSSVITLAMLSSVFFYDLVAAVLVSQGQTFVMPGIPGLPMALAAAAVVCAAGGPWFFRMRAQALTGSSGDPELALERLLRARIVGLALAECAAVLGLVLTLITGRMAWCLGLSTLALLAMLTLWPRRRQLERVAFRGEALPIEPD